MATEDQNKRPAGRLFFEAVMWGMGFAVGAGAMRLTWGAITGGKKDDDDEERSERDERDERDERNDYYAAKRRRENDELEAYQPTD